MLAGGVGSRFWPVSTPSRPKQLLPLAGAHPLIADAVGRIRDLVPLDRLRILTGPGLAAAILQNVPGLDARHLLVEPRARGTAPVLAWAAWEISRQDPDAVMISLHADHIIEPAADFHALVRSAADVASRHRRLVTIGIAPTRPDTGYGYIRPGAELAGGGHAVAEFVEKPDAETARRYVADGFLWNSGIFIWRVADVLEEVRRHTPEIAPRLDRLASGEIDVDAYFAGTPALSIDEGVLERSERVAVLRADFRWDDVGGWDAVARNRDADERGNVAVGDAQLVDSDGCVVWSENGAVVLFGVRDTVVVHANGVTFVAPRERTAALKELLARLPENLRNLDGA